MGEAFFYILGIILEVIVLTPLAGVATVGYCLIFCVKNYITAMAGNLKRVAFDPKSKEPAVENYCFGIGQKQAVQILKDTVSENFSVTLKDTLEFGKDRLDDSDLIAEKIIGLSVIICSSVFITVIASAMAGVAFALHFLLLSLVSLVIYLISGAANLTERLYLWAHKIFADCPVHKERFVVPAFLCPKCGKMHRKLIPNKYGIFHHTCACGNKLPSALITGRNRLEACCPVCKCTLISSSARPVVYQLVGGSCAGKTTFMTAFYHHFFERVNQNAELDCQIPKDYSSHFQDMEKWYNGMPIPSTFEHNAQLYPVMLKSKKLRTPRQFSIYDISGEMFDGTTSSHETAQEQMKFCNGIFFVIDPFSDGLIRKKREQENADISGFSNINPEYVAGNFINYLISIQAIKVSSKSKIPVSVLIVKADEPEVKPQLSPAKIKANFKANPEKYRDIQESRDEICKTFLRSIHLDGAVNQLESRFENLHYFPVSAMGHEADGTPFQPWGVDEASCWLTQLADKELAKELDMNFI